MVYFPSVGLPDMVGDVLDVKSSKGGPRTLALIQSKDQAQMKLKA